MSTRTHDHPRLQKHNRMPPVTAALTVVIAAVFLAACGGSSKSSTTSSTNATKPNAAGSNQFSSLRACLQKQGINLPSAPAAGGGQPGNGGPPSGGPPGAGAGGFKLPEGTSQAKFQEAMKKCGGGGFPGGARRPINSAALTKYSQCMRENGVNLPPANTNGNGPVFNTKGIDTSTTTFKNAQKKCQSDLKGAFGSGPPPGGGQAGPPAEGGGASGEESG